MLLTQKNILLICLSLLVAFAPVPSLVANAATNMEVPCSMSMDMESMMGHVTDPHSQINKTDSQQHCNNCSQDNHTCQQCECSVLGCTFSKVQLYTGSTLFPRFTVNHSELVNYISHPPHSRLAAPLLRPPIKLHS